QREARAAKPSPKQPQPPTESLEFCRTSKRVARRHNYRRGHLRRRRFLRIQPRPAWLVRRVERYTAPNRTRRLSRPAGFFGWLTRTAEFNTVNSIFREGAFAMNFLVHCCTIFLLSGAVLFAQGTSSSVNGTLVDPSGAGIPG